MVKFYLSYKRNGGYGMGIDFHSKENQQSYTTRNVHSIWSETIQSLVPFDHVSTALDVGCGGGIYSKALSDMGVDSIIGVDFSHAMLEGAKENCKGYPRISFTHGHAFDTGVEGESIDLLLERALIHHLQDLSSCFKEGHRVLKEEGCYIIQDRTPEDCLVEGSDQHIRGYFFKLFPRLIEKETSRRHTSQTVIHHLKAAGFKEIEERKLWEIRKVYNHKNQLLQDLKERVGRSILHELDDKEIQHLIQFIDRALPSEGQIVEKDRWTIWRAVK